MRIAGKPMRVKVAHKFGEAVTTSVQRKRTAMEILSDLLLKSPRCLDPLPDDGC